jgi:hypothetical protein
MMLINVTGLDRKSGGAQWRDLRFSGPFLEVFLDFFPRYSLTLVSLARGYIES